MTLQQIANELEEISENLSALEERTEMNWYSDKSEINDNIFRGVRQLRAEAFDLFDKVSTLARKEELDKKFESANPLKINRGWLEEAQEKLTKIVESKGYFDSYDLYEVLTGDDPENCPWPYQDSRMI